MVIDLMLDINFKRTTSNPETILLFHGTATRLYTEWLELLPIKTN